MSFGLICRIGCGEFSKKNLRSCCWNAGLMDLEGGGCKVGSIEVFGGGSCKMENLDGDGGGGDHMSLTLSRKSLL